jgi:two-component system cell cycle sensor histidine kinase/response regulator CckA
MNAFPCDAAELARTLFDETADALFLFDPGSKKIRDVNPSASRLTGCARADLLHRPISERVRSAAPGDELPLDGAVRACEGLVLFRQDEDVWIPVNLAITRLTAGPRPLSLLRAHDLREQRTARINRTQVMDRAGAVVGVLGICWDVTDQRALEAQLRHVHKMDAIGQLAGGIAHDFNNLLTIMLGNLSYVLTQNHDAHANLELIRNAEKAGLRAAELTQTLLGFSRRAALATVPFHLNPAIDEVVRLTRSTLPANIELEVRAQPHLWLVQADAGHINQVLTNLTLNARDALPEGGKITYQTSHFIPDADYLSSQVESHPGEYVRLRVRDTGNGIPAELRQRIFEPFFTTKEKGTGAGLGLAIVFSIVRQHHGWIVCESDPSSGTTFDLFLPRCQLAPAAPEIPPTSVPAAPREIILLVDDENMIRQLAKTILTKGGYEVFLAENGAVALEVVLAHPGQVALIILDAIMPRLSGRDTLRELARIAPHISVLFSSGYSTEQMAVNEFPQIRGFLPKPYRAEQLIQKVAEILGHARRTAGDS